MKNSEIISRNRLIATFMNFEKTTEDRYEEWVAKYPENQIVSEYFVTHHTKLTKKQENKLLQFHSSWDWLMPVIKKIDYDYRYIHISEMKVWIEAFLSSDIKAVYKMVVDIIELKNKYKSML